MRLLSLSLLAALIVGAGLFAFHASKELPASAGAATKANPEK